ncbi:glutathione-specific gamma-glutamylcyclotransferase 1 [Methylobacterium phyllosphaerae]|uniref:glutathione-specific gamma-glutamylcyclotransferase n=1 Tax=Methylobacterium phyllosphaerae TaxID=418223 RepID=A0AAE8L4Y5_9HYPH|nr:gamma-glutamylcyclotransferase [Methylobacterium phyllosphaerae]APT30921.1 glutathione-specific gamma-glutamylcyclotransferase 1 [Methylobacterium phyllosphaerae]SFG34406.1 cation transport protein ChaC [Methylobacterium phyllosphaerae]
MPCAPARTLDLSLDLIARAHSVPVPDDPSALDVLSDSELRPGLEAIVAGREGCDLWVFAYGSLMWNPEFEVAERRIGTVRGFHRRFCLLQRRFRGTPERPGFVLALDRGGLCRGVVFRLPGMEIREALMPVWRREMRGRGYVARWLPVATETGTVSALTFLANRASDRYAGRLSDAEIAEKIAAACGHKGPSAEYLFRTVDACERLGIRDRHLWSLQALVAARLRACAPGA